MKVLVDVGCCYEERKKTRTSRFAEFFEKRNQNSCKWMKKGQLPSKLDLLSFCIRHHFDTRTIEVPYEFNLRNFHFMDIEFLRFCYFRSTNNQCSYDCSRKIFWKYRSQNFAERETKRYQIANDWIDWTRRQRANKKNNSLFQSKKSLETKFQIYIFFPLKVFFSFLHCKFAWFRLSLFLSLWKRPRNFDQNITFLMV